MRKLSPAKIMTLGAMCTALSVLSLYASCVLPTAKLAFYFLSSVFIYMLADEEAYVGALVSFAASLLLGFVILPDKAYLFPYAALLGHYGIFKTWLSRRTGDKVLQFFLRMLYCNLFAGAGVCAAVFLFSYDIKMFAGQLPLPIWLLVPILEAAFVLFDTLYWVCQKFYDERIKAYLIPRR